MKKAEIINHFIKFFIYDLKQGNKNKVYIEDVEFDLKQFLKPYIKDEHYNFSPFEEIKERKEHWYSEEIERYAERLFKVKGDE